MTSNEPKRVGRRVFPTPESENKRLSQQFSKKFIPPPEPPIDYTIRIADEKPAYRVVHNVFPRSTSPDFLNDEEHLACSSSFHPKKRQDTVEDILDELDTVLYEASIPFDELRKKVENFNISFKPYAPEIKCEDLPEIPYSGEPRRVARLDHRNSRNRENETQILDRKNSEKLEEMRKKTIQSIEEAKEKFSPLYFKKEFSQEGVPEWKRNLLATKKSKEFLKKIEYDKWMEFENFKKTLKPKEKIKRSKSVQLASHRNRRQL